MKTKAEIVAEVKKYFKIQEFVEEITYKTWGENAWNFLDDRLLETIVILRRDILKVPLVCNDWCFKGNNTQRGLRSNLSYLVKEKTDANKLYLSQHNMGKAVDMVSSKMTAENMRKLIKANESKLPYQVRIEDGVTWLHIDVMNALSQKNKIYFFKG